MKGGNLGKPDNSFNNIRNSKRKMFGLYPQGIEDQSAAVIAGPGGFQGRSKKEDLRISMSGQGCVLVQLTLEQYGSLSVALTQPVLKESLKFLGLVSRKNSRTDTQHSA